MKKVLTALGCVAGALMLGAGQASAGVSCHNINAREVGRDLGAGNFAADVKGGGLLHGTSAASLALSGGPVVFAVNGPLTFTTNKGTLTVNLNGMFVVSGSTGTYASSGPVVAATGKLAGATGSLTVVGAENLVTLTIASKVSGTICADLSP